VDRPLHREVEKVVIGPSSARVRQPDFPVELAPEERKLGPYRLCRRVASGGMASVYLAFREGSHGFEKMVAVKRIHPHLAHEREFVDMFLDEARLAARINHPYVCNVTDFGEADNGPYLAMEYVVGEPISRILAQLRRRRDLLGAPRFPRIVTRLIANLCEGLHAAHEVSDDEGHLLGLVHRDITPQNMFVAFDGSVRVLDFGVARAESCVHETRPGIVKGKLAYVAPEVFRRETIDRRTDIWSMGVVLWELLTGRHLFKRESDAAIITAVTSEEVPPPSSINEHVPAELDQVVAFALRHNPDERYRTAREMGRDLEACLGAWRDPVPAADVAEWVMEIFPGSYSRHQQLIFSARQSEGRARPTPRQEDIDLSALVVSLGSADRVRDLEMVAPPAPLATPPRWALASAGAVVLVLVTWALWLGGRPAPGPPLAAPPPHSALKLPVPTPVPDVAARRAEPARPAARRK
jgi:serine/threonine protein kinase